MARFLLSLSTCALLAACGDPLAKVDKLSSVDVADTAPMVEIAATADKNPRGGFFSRLRGNSESLETPVLNAQDAAVSDALSEAGAVQVPGDAQAPAETLAVAAGQTEPPKRGGLFGFLRAKDKPGATLPAEQLAEQSQELLEPEKADSVTGDTEIAAVPVAEQPKKRGFLGLLSGARAKDRAQDANETVQTASLGPVVAPQAAPKETLFSKREKNHKGPDAQIVPFGTVLPSGAIARVCDVPTGRLGKQVGKFPERGKGYKMFDSAPSSSAPRPFYVTGFGDNCARTFTAALALFGSPTMHEQLRYGLPSQVQPYSTTDKAYEGIKRSVCGAAKRKPCGAKIKLLEKNTAFISVYDRFGSNASWSNLLLHKGWVLAADRKG